MNLKLVAKQVRRTLVRNAPKILTAIGCGGVVTTIFLTIRATESYMADPEPAENTRMAQAKHIAKHFWPVGVSAAITCAAILGVDKTHGDREAALAAVCQMGQTKLTGLQKQVVEQQGRRALEKCESQEVKERIMANPPKGNMIIDTGDGNVLFHEPWSGVHFLSDRTKLDNARNWINERVNEGEEPTLNDYLEKIKIPSKYFPKFGDYIGWGMYPDKLMMNVHYIPVIFDDDTKETCTMIDFDIRLMWDPNGVLR